MTLVGGAGAAPEGSASSASLRGSRETSPGPTTWVRPATGWWGRMNAGESPRNQGRSVWPPLSASRRRSRDLRKTPQWGAERRAGPRHGSAIPSADGMGLAARQTNGRGVPRLRISALRYPLLEGRRVRNRQFGTTARRDAPRGNAGARVSKCMEKITMPKFAHLTLHVMRGLDPRIHEAMQRRKPHVVALHHGWPGHRRAKRRRPSDGYARP